MSYDIIRSPNAQIKIFGEEKMDQIMDQNIAIFMFSLNMLDEENYQITRFMKLVIFAAMSDVTANMTINSGNALN